MAAAVAGLCRVGLNDTTIKYLLLLFNACFATCGLVVMALGAAMLASPAKVLSGVSYSLFIFTFVGVVCMLVPLLGACGAIRESNCLLVSYAASLAAIMALQTVASALLVAHANVPYAPIEDVFQAARRGDEDMARVAALVQSSFRCCGYRGPDFWDPSALLPACCCEGALVAQCPREKAFQEGCRDALGDFVWKYGTAFGAVGLAVPFMQAVGIWFSLALAYRIRELERRMKHL